ncbi:acyltransferase [Mesobacillus jeotgali]|uniref:Acyltransferase n=1 Tax=Mesobacillus jeotgali TaxID=129985 RepID=A0ABY9VJA1_9BACI|nr:acyltransferase [Mesobacillus jeotgali]WNF22675.1 acyltransferase [Mesobacillus jeotgali]
MGRDLRIDYLKAMAIISVILLHSFKTDYENSILGPYHILQAVPVFLLLTGLNLVNSFERKKITNLIYFYSLDQIAKRLKRLLIPFTIVWIFQLYVLVSSSGHVLKIKEVFLTFIQGGWGPGSYFIPLILQVVFGLPLLYLWAKRNPMNMLIGTFIINFAFELYAYYSYMPNEIYRFIFLRYIFIIGLGVYMAFKPNWNKWFEIGTFVSLVYITAVHYYGFKPAVQPNWSSQNVYAYFWPYALVIFGLSRLKNTASSIAAKVMKTIGEASYHIFLTQMVYFWAFQPFPTMRILYGYPPTKLAFINIFLCLIFGVAFYYIEKLLFGKIKIISLLKSKKTAS